MFKQSDSDSHGEDSWVSWDSWIGWDEIEDSWRMGRPDFSKDRSKKESSRNGVRQRIRDRDRRKIFRERPRSQRAREKLGAVLVKGVLMVLI